jgi:hypothetical protein
MAQPVAGPKELNLNKPEVFDGNQEGFKDFFTERRGINWPILLILSADYEEQ